MCPLPSPLRRHWQRRDFHWGYQVLRRQDWNTQHSLRRTHYIQDIIRYCSICRPLDPDNLLCNQTIFSFTRNSQVNHWLALIFFSGGHFLRYLYFCIGYVAYSNAVKVFSHALLRSVNSWKRWIPGLMICHESSSVYRVFACGASTPQRRPTSRFSSSSSSPSPFVKKFK